MLSKFTGWFEKDSPNFINSYGSLSHFYDKATDTFQIDEIESAYQVMKKGGEPESLYFLWGHVV